MTSPSGSASQSHSHSQAVQASSSVNSLHSFIQSNLNPTQSFNFLKKPSTHQLQTSSYEPLQLIEFNTNTIQNTFDLLHHNNPSSSAPPHLSLFDFHHQDINLYDCINSQTLPLSAPLPQSINLNKPQIDHLTLTLEDHSSRIQNIDQPLTLQENDSIESYSHHQSHSTQQGNLNQYTILSQSNSGSQASFRINQPHSSLTLHPSNLLPAQHSLPNTFSLIDSIKTNPLSSRPDRFDSDNLGQRSASLNPLDLPENSLPPLLLNNISQSTKNESQLLLEPYANVPISPLDQFTPVALSEYSNGSPNLKAKPNKLICNSSATSTLSQDFRRRKDWTKKLIEDIEDVIQVVAPTGEILFLTETMSRLTGFKTSDLMNSKLFDWCFEEEDCVNLKREMKNCTLHGNQLSLYCRFKKKDSDGFVILEMIGHMIDTQSDSDKPEEKGNQRAILINGRLYPTSCAQLMDNFLELMIDNEMLMRKLRSREQGLDEWSEVGESEEEEGVQGETEKVIQKRKNKRKVSQSTRIAPLDVEDDESEDEINPDDEPSNDQVIGRNYPSKPCKRPKKCKIDFLCLDCGVTQSPEWRKGPMGRKTLCNACGLRYAKKGQVVNNATIPSKK